MSVSATHKHLSLLDYQTLHKKCHVTYHVILHRMFVPLVHIIQIMKFL